MTIAERVENILRVSQKARNSDRELLIIYMQKSGLDLTPAQVQKIRDLPAFETITRVRRVLQEQGKYPASEEVEQARFEKYKNVRNNINYKSPEQVLEEQGYRIVDD